MALTATSKNQLNALLALLTAKDVSTCDALASASRRALSSANGAFVAAILPIDAGGTVNATAATAVATLLADIAAN